MKKSAELRQTREELLAKAEAINELTKVEKRHKTEDERSKFASYLTQAETLHGEIEAAEEEERLAKVKFDAATQVNPQIERVSQIEVGANPRDNRIRGSNEYRSAFLNYLRLGPNNLRPEETVILQNEQRALGTGTGSGGGFLVPEGFQAMLEKALKAFGGVREAASSIATDSGEDLPWPVTNDTSNAGEWLTESATATEGDPSFGQVVFKAHTISSKYVYVPLNLLQDSAIDIEAELSTMLGERIARGMNAAFTTGDGINKPEGFINGATSAGTTASATAITYEELLTLKHGVDPLYRNGARFMFNDSTLKAVLGLKDSYGHYYFQPDSTGREAQSIFGFPYTINQDMASIASTTKAVAFGNFQRGYKIRDVRGISVLRLSEIRALYRQVVFVAFARTDGHVLDAGTNPIQFLTQKT